MEAKDMPKYRYDSYIDLDEENSPWTKMVELMGEKKRVIDFGCATGYLAEALRGCGCNVIGIDNDEEALAKAARFCEQIIKADIDELNLKDFLGGRKVDVAIFGDVLEHLRDPKRVLQMTRDYLTEDGFVVASVPNIAYPSIRLQLLAGNFDYTETGLLDSSHLRFFTKRSLIHLFEESGYIPVLIDCVVQPVRQKDFLGLPPSIVNPLMSLLQGDSTSDVFQYIIKSSTEQ